MAIESIAAAGAASAVQGAPARPVSAAAEPFGRLLDAASSSHEQANLAVGRMVEGTGEVHDAMIALQQADLMLQFTVQVRNKLVQAYQDIMRMPV
jgi:flagellar hook-basal body complex protein FliE